MRWPLVLLLSALLPPVDSLRATSYAATPDVGKGKIFFLMLADDGIEQEDIWVNFLSGGRHGVNYEAYIHCSNYEGCKRNLKRRDLFTLVPKVPSLYCADLVSPMLALLSAAYKHSKPGNPHDKFVLVSDNSVPVKPFWRAHQILTVGKEGVASFSFFPEDFQKCGFFKASQWFVLSNWHAGRMLKAAYEKLPEPTGQCYEGSCLDENWPLVGIYGEAELRKWPKYPKALERTRYWWTDWNHRYKLSYEREALAGPMGPAVVKSASPEFLRELRSMENVLFARKFMRTTKFDGNLSLPEAFNEYLFKNASHH